MANGKVSLYVLSADGLRRTHRSNGDRGPLFWADNTVVVVVVLSIRDSSESDEDGGLLSCTRGSGMMRTVLRIR